MQLSDLLAPDSGAAERSELLWLGYTETSGHPELRRAICTVYEHVTADQVLVHAGAEGAIFNNDNDQPHNIDDHMVPSALGFLATIISLFACRAIACRKSGTKDLD